MTTATHTEMMNIAKQAAAYINRLNGECDTFEIDGTTLTAVITYEGRNRRGSGRLLDGSELVDRAGNGER